MTQFHEGQDVEVAISVPVICNQNDPPVYHELEWRKAKVIVVPGDRNQFLVRFPDGSRAVFDAEHIRAIEIKWFQRKPSHNELWKA